MRAFCEIIVDLESDLSKIKNVSDNISDQKSFALSPRAYVRIIQPGNYRHFEEKHGIVAFEKHFLVVINLNASI